MKKFFFLLTILFCAVLSFAQHVPQGMKYQAVARNLSGNVLVNQSITLKINLLTQDNMGSVIYYSETHAVTTNQLGLFSLTIGEGKIEKGKFADIPWSTADIWMQVAIKDKGQSDFMTISNSKLLAVPYAFHAGTAAKLSDDNATSTSESAVTTTSTTSSSTNTTSTSPSANWSLKGNVGSNPAKDKLGTGDFVDLLLVTNNTERIRILANGNVVVANDLTVNKNVTLNTVSGTTTDINGLTHLKNIAQSNTITDGALVVDGGVGIAKNLNVGGNLKVNGSSTLNSLAVTNDVKATSLNIKGDSSGFVATITNTNTGEGDGLKIKLGRIHPMWNGTEYESIEVDDFNPVYHAFQEQITLVEGWVKTKQVSISSGDVWSLVKNTGEFLGGALCQLTNAISPALNEKLGLPLDLATPINQKLGLPLDLATPINDKLNLPLDLTKPINDGLHLPINLGPYSIPDVDMPAVELPALSVGVGSLGSFDIIGKTTLFPKTTLLHGFTLISKTEIVPILPKLEIPAIPKEYLTIPAIPAVALTIPAIPQIDCSGLPTIGAPNIKTTDVANSLNNKNEFVKFVDKDERVLGVIRAQSIGDFSDRYFSKEYLFHLVSAVGGIDIAKGLLNLANEFNKLGHTYNKLGVEYVSGNGDYAEWMERENLEESISAGDIVGVKGGKITKDIKGAEQIMAVSTQPIVNANMPNKDKVGFGNSIAFMGQIPVKIIGAVTTGDFIVAKGDIPGYGVAVKTSQMTTEDFRLVVGRAWETINIDGPKMVNTLVGVQNNDFLKIIEKYQQKVSDAEARLDAIEKRLNMNTQANQKK
ncbi:MAG: Legionella vir region protein [Chitinophagaceae bacterium]|nr:Legionella vir region protein [Chitinophagaceae bacterium]